MSSVPLGTHHASKYEKSTSQVFLEPDPNRIRAVDANGDLLLGIDDIPQGTLLYYRVSSIVLRAASPYFYALLDPGKFSEGAAFSTRLRHLTAQYCGISSIPAEYLPNIHVSEIGQYPAASSTKVVMHFFEILHGGTSSAPTTRALMNHIALLAIVADRFGATKPVADYIVNQGWTQPGRATKGTKLSSHRLSVRSRETALRQCIFAGAVLGVQEWVMQSSRNLIDEGSDRWNTCIDAVSSSTSQEQYDGPWWNLPYGLEEELEHRRECILATIESLQDYFLQQYTSSRRQCRLGYDSSLQCDSFQLGEMIRFLTRKGTLRLQGRITEAEGSTPYLGSINQLLLNLRECPAYQIDKNHSHCGLRTELLVRLNHVHPILVLADQIGICQACWQTKKLEHSWRGKPTRLWRFMHGLATPKFHSKISECGYNHDSAKTMFTAEQRDWSTEK